MNHKMADIRQLHAPLDILNASLTLERVLRLMESNSLALIKQDEWIAVPVESGYHFSDTDQDHLLRAIMENGEQRIFAIALEKLDDLTSVFEVSPTKEGISAFNKISGHFNFALFAGEPFWVVICTTNEYFIVAGKSDFVRSALDSEPEISFTRFYEFASDITWPENIRTSLLLVLNSLKEHYANAQSGTIVPIA